MRSYSGDPLDATYQSITERPELEEQAHKVEYATDPEPGGTETTEGVPVPGEPESDELDRPVVRGQTTLSEWSRL
ncbi:hypothetical protein HTZ84_05120 [Haloterrigena sp. SYSU A558-1]|uniref:Uncharacterized protein n=1 Tax=Haloterrigena gelatinilytica TaxID=2741724 RepID=A0ABX2L607_9EURY|nr:hypothetical protein [Haloterrigena gelatinilytica]NUC71694.1 hypothetical protein [Haloterrigena gelatinilytica]